jgi:metal-dependent amidase/aminoacylase/carboxypeptidase family protein
LALKEVAGTIGLTVCVQIDPEEEGRGGKPKKLEAGDYDGLHLYMAPHMGGHNWEELPSIGNQPYEVRMVGVSSHDASARERGNPVKPGFETFNERLKQLELGYNVEPGTVINQQGGPYFPGQANVISAVGIQQVMVRNASTSALSSDVMAKVERGAKYSGATFDLGVVGRRLAPMYAGPRTDDTLMDLFKESVDSAPDIKRTFRPAPLTAKPSSTDNWNVAHAIPTIHPMLAINEAEAELPLHTVEMAIAANPERNTKGISRAIVEGGMAFALTGARIAVDPAARSRFTARNFSARDTLAGDRPEWMSAFPGWDKPEILNEGIGVDLQLLSAAMDSKSPVFRIP